MGLDFKSWTAIIGSLIGVLSTIITIILKFKPKKHDELKRDLEILNIAKETGVNYLPISRKVEQNIHDLYIEIIVDRNSIYFTSITLFMMFFLFLTSITVGVMYIVIVFVLGKPEAYAEDLIVNVVAFLMLMGLAFGLMNAGNEYDKAKKNAVDTKERIVKQDKLTISESS